jgi:hypothetical protein
MVEMEPLIKSTTKNRGRDSDRPGGPNEYDHKSMEENESRSRSDDG